MAHKEIITHLNAALKNKLTGINQYFLHARMLKHKGNVKLADYEYKASIDAMKHADMLVEHILSLGGAPALQELGTLAIGLAEAEMLKGDLALAEAALAQLGAAMDSCTDDQATAALLGRIAASQQEHIAFIHAQLATFNSQAA